MQYTSVNRQTENQPVVCRMGTAEKALKRLLDILFALLGLLLSLPITLLVAVMLKLSADGPVFYRQERIGLGGKPFHIIKFRTMTPDAEPEGPQLEQTNDPRLTRIGRYLRNHHIDELPQFWNVLVGDMSMVGPRPERQYFIDRIMQHDARYQYILNVRPGVTSEAALYNGYAGTIDKMLERLNMDLHYMETATVVTDLAIMAKTIGKIVFGEEKK